MLSLPPAAIVAEPLAPASVPVTPVAVASRFSEYPSFGAVLATVMASEALSPACRYSVPGAVSDGAASR